MPYRRVTLLSKTRNLCGRVKLAATCRVNEGGRVGPTALEIAYPRCERLSALAPRVCPQLLIRLINIAQPQVRAGLRGFSPAPMPQSSNGTGQLRRIRFGLIRPSEEPVDWRRHLDAARKTETAYRNLIYNTLEWSQMTPNGWDS